jgi:two-component system alkaline phosphatase synthesis response regulator PhoP
MKKTIFIVDDDPGVRYTVKTGLESIDEEINVVSLEKGTDFFELLEKKEIPDLILLDIMMPEMNGWEIQRRLRERVEWRRIPIVFLSAIEDRTSKKIGDLTSEDFIEKPFTIPDLKKRIDKILDY